MNAVAARARRRAVGRLLARVLGLALTGCLAAPAPGGSGAHQPGGLDTDMTEQFLQRILE